MDFALDLAQNNRTNLFFLAMVFMCITVFGLLNGLIGIFSNAFHSASKIAFGQHNDTPLLAPLEMGKHLDIDPLEAQTIRRESLWSVVLGPSVSPDNLLDRRHSSVSTVLDSDKQQHSKQPPPSDRVLMIQTQDRDAASNIIPTHQTGSTPAEEMDQGLQVGGNTREKDILTLSPSSPRACSAGNETKSSLINVVSTSPTEVVSDNAAILKEKQLVEIQIRMRKLRKAYKKNSQLMRRAMDDLQAQVDLLATSY